MSLKTSCCTVKPRFYSLTCKLHHFGVAENFSKVVYTIISVSSFEFTLKCLRKKLKKKNMYNFHILFHVSIFRIVMGEEMS